MKLLNQIAGLIGAPVALLCPIAARAQQVQSSTPVPPDVKATSPYDVDMKSGFYAPEVVDLTIGNPGGGGFAVSRMFEIYGLPGTAKPLRTNWNYDLFRAPNAQGGDLFSIRNRSVGVSFLTTNWTSYADVSLGANSNRTLTRYASGSNFYFIYKEDGGTTITFLPSANGAAPAQQVKYANGVTYEFSYDLSNTRLRTVTSNAGYQLIYEYTSASSDLISKICAINLSITTPPATPVCPAGVQSVSYTYDGTGKRLTSVTDTSGDTETISTTFTSYAAPFTESYTHAGESQPWLTNSYQLDSNFGIKMFVGQQSFGNGKTVSYNFDVLGNGEFSGFALIGLGWTENGAASTVLEWGVYQADYRYTPAVTPTPTKVTDPLNRSVATTYNGSWKRILDQKQPLGQKLSLSYDVNGHITAQKLDEITPNPATALITEYGYDCTVALNCDKPISKTDPRGAVTDYTYDATHGGMLTSTAPAPTGGAVRPQMRYTWNQYYAWYKNGSGTLVQAAAPVWLVSSISECQTLASCTGTADEVKTSFTYGTAGAANNLLVTQKTIAAGDNSLSATTTWTYDANGDKLTEDGPLAGSADTTRWRYDSERRVIGVIEPDPDGGGARVHRATRNTYDVVGRLTKVETGTVNSQSDSDWAAFSAAESIEYQYDIMSRKTREVHKGGATVYGVTHHNYDSYGRLKCTAVRMDPAIWLSQTDACVPQTTAADGPDRITRNGYDLAGQLVQVEEGVGTSAAGNEAVYAYTDNGKVATVKDGENNLTAYAYDGFDRLVKTSFPVATKGASNPSSTDYEELVLDRNGNVTERRLRGYASDSNRRINYTIDALNRITNKTAQGEHGVNYSYDLLGRMKQAHRPGDGNNVTRSWDALGRMLTDGQSFGALSYQYDAGGRRTRVTWNDGFYAIYDYDVLGGVTAIHENGAATLASYSYDSRGRRAGVTYANGTTRSYAYDPVSRLEGLQIDLSGTTQDQLIGKVGGLGTAIGYNPPSQIKSITRSNDAYAWIGHSNVIRTYTSNGLNQYSQTASTPLSGGPVMTSYSYDSQGNLTAAGSAAYSYSRENLLKTAPGGVTLHYDTLGRMVEYNSSVSTRFLYNGGAIAAEVANSSGAVLRRYVPGPDVDEPIVWYEGSGTSDRRYLHADERGSIVAVTNGSGASLAINSYDEYGNPDALNLGRFQYTGQAWLPEVGLAYYKARMYSPSLGRFMQTDPIGYKDGLNWYNYAGSDPVNRFDPNGEDSWLVSRSTPYVGMDHMFVVVVDNKTGNVVARYSFSHTTGSLGKLISGHTKLVSVSGSVDPTNFADARAWRDYAGGSRTNVSAIKIDASDVSVLAAGNKVTSALGTIENPGQMPYVVYGTNSNAAAYAIADIAVTSEGQLLGSQELPEGVHPGSGAYRQVEFAADKKERETFGIKGTRVTGNRSCGTRISNSSGC